MQLLLLSQVSLVDAERWERTSEDLATLSRISLERTLRTVWSYTKKAGTSQCSEESPIWRKFSKDTIWVYMTKCAMQLGKSLPAQSQLLLSRYDLRA